MIHLRYLVYVLRHKWYVFWECVKLGIVWQGITHDLSKFSREEWGPYAVRFFGDADTSDESNDQLFEKAWEHHYLTNPHHWQYWSWWHTVGQYSSELLPPQEPSPMPPRYRKEMLADWLGFGKMRGKGPEDARAFYLSKRDEIKLHPETRQWVEAQLGIRHGD